MNKKEKAKEILEILNKLFPNPEVPLVHDSDYTLLIAVLLSAQCTDKKVNEITPKLFKKAKTPYEMVLLNVGEIKEIIKPCGLSTTKAKAIKNLSKKLIEEFNGKVPKTFKELESLPGVGHKTASVVMIQAFDQLAFPVDTHIHRLAKRWGLSCGKNVNQTEKDLKRLFPKKYWKKLHLQLIFYGREYCPAKKHSKEKCPICRLFS